MAEPSPAPARLAVLLSGAGRTLLNLHDRIRNGEIAASIALVVASSECPGAQAARQRSIPTLIIPGRLDRHRFEAILREHEIDWVVLAGYLKLLDIPDSYRGRVINIHPALLPKHGGTGMFGHRVHQAVLAAGDQESGCTVHFCDDLFDTGPIILQRRCSVKPGDTPETLAARVFEQECIAYPEALRLLISGAVSVPGASGRADRT